MSSPPPAETDRAASTAKSPRLDEDGRERPEFLAAFPADPELDELRRAFEAGNFALIRSKAQTLADKTADPAVRAAAMELRQRIDPDPLVVQLLAIALGLLAFLVGWAYVAH